MARNHKLAKSIHDAGLSTFATMLKYKVLDRGNCFVVMDTFFPSTQLCSECGIKSTTKIQQGEKEWVCPTCDTHHDRDINAARNLELAGRVVYPLWYARMQANEPNQPALFSTTERLPAYSSIAA